MINIIAHRGVWTKSSEQNTINSFKTALINGFGIETDLRDHNGNIVISHDMPKGDCVSLDTFLELCQSQKNVTLALNIKADGLSGTLSKIKIPNSHFFFDMSVPDMLSFVKKGLVCYSRYSNIEQKPALYKFTKGIWLDNFEDDLLNLTILNEFLADDKYVVLVSPELHGRKKETYWMLVKKFLETNTSYNNKLGICTDFPMDAKRFFNEK